jgi:proteasome alpha subunit
MTMQGNNQQAYDRGTSLFSPDGRIYQVEYAREAVKRGAPSLGLRTEEGVVLVAQSRAGSELMEAESIEKLHKLDDHVGAASAGHVADARKLIDFAREQAQRNRLRYDEPIGVETLAKRITDNLQESTQRGGIRPFGAALLVGGVEDGEPHLFETDPSGTPHEWQATAIGGNRGDLLEFLEAEYDPELSLEEGVTLAVRALLQVVDDLSAADVSVATVGVDEGYHDLTAEEKESALERARSDE